MSDFDHREWSYRALIVAGWTNLQPNPQRGGWWMGTDPRGHEYQPAPRLTYNQTKVLWYCLPYQPKIEFFDNDVSVNVGPGRATVAFTDCKGSAMIALARALTLALARVEGEQLELFKE